MKFIKLPKWAKENELADDLIAVVTSFCAKLYGKRRGKPSQMR